MPRTLRLAIVALMAAFALSGCLRFTSDLTVSEQNTVSGEYVVAVENGSGKSLNLTDRELAEELWGDSGLALGLKDPRIDDYRKDGYTGIVVRFDEQPLTAFAPTSTRFGISRTGDEFVVSGTLSGGSETTTTSTTKPDIRVSMTFPGKVLSSNGEAAGRTVTWTITENNVTLTARASAIAESDSAVILAYVVAAVLAVAAIAYWLAGVIGRWRYPEYQRG